MNKCDISIRFCFLDEQFTDEIVDVLHQAAAETEVFVDADEHICVTPIHGNGNVQLSYNGRSFDDVIVPLPGHDRDRGDENDDSGTDLVVSFSTRDHNGIKALILELVDSAIQSR